MATVRLIIAIVVLELAFQHHNIDQTTWFIGYSILLGSWIFGGETGRIADTFWKIKQFLGNFLTEYYDESEEKEGKSDG